MNCPRGLHSKERETGNNCSQPLEIGFFYYVSLKKSHNTFPIYIEKERKNDYGASQKVRISR